MQMKKYCIAIFLMLFYLGSSQIVSSPAKADTTLAKELTINQIKITGDEFLVLRNATPYNMNLAGYWLEYFNDFDLSNLGISNSSQQLPSVILQPGQEILLTVGAAANCGQVWVSKLSFSFKDSTGLVQVVGINQSSGVVSYKTQDQVSWSSKTGDAVDIKGVSPSSTAQIWYKASNGWLSTASPVGCYAVGVASSPTSTLMALTRINSSPPSIALGDPGPASGAKSSNLGLDYPQISEALPNPSSPQTDSTDEFIELYNPNSSQFDLSGFVLRTGNSTYHTYTFPDGQFSLQPHEFRAFFAPQTGINLSNSEGQVALLNREGDLVEQSDIYSDAKDGTAWIFANGTWQWTTVPTPNSSNVVAPPIVKASSAKTKSTKSVKSASKSAKTPSKKSTTNSPTFSSSEDSQNYLHPLVLAGVGLLALLYACYEYRHDIANQLYKLRRDRKIRPQIGPSV